MQNSNKKSQDINCYTQMHTKKHISNLVSKAAVLAVVPQTS